jgi:hypothetical protein
MKNDIKIIIGMTLLLFLAPVVFFALVKWIHFLRILFGL